MNHCKTLSYRTILYVINRFILRKKYLIAKSNYGVKFKIKSADAVGRTIYKTGNYEPQITNYVLNEIKFDHKDIVIDVGANIGWYSLIFNCIENKPDIIYAFEPDPLNYSLLVNNINLNNASNIIAINKALSSKEGSATLYKYGEKNLGRHSMLPIFNGDREIVTTTTLDSFLKINSNKIIKLMKIDVEGYEFQVLLGAKSALDRTINLIIELSPVLMRQHNIEPNSVIQMLYDKGFKPYSFGVNQIIPIDQKLLLQNQEVSTLLWRRESSSI